MASIWDEELENITTELKYILSATGEGTTPMENDLNRTRAIVYVGLLLRKVVDTLIDIGNQPGG